MRSYFVKCYAYYYHKIVPRCASASESLIFPPPVYIFCPQTKTVAVCVHVLYLLGQTCLTGWALSWSRLNRPRPVLRCWVCRWWWTVGLPLLPLCVHSCVASPCAAERNAVLTDLLCLFITHNSPFQHSSFCNTFVWNSVCVCVCLCVCVCVCVCVCMHAHMWKKECVW